MRHNKFGAKKTTVNGITFDSKWESIMTSENCWGGGDVPDENDRWSPAEGLSIEAIEGFQPGKRRQSIRPVADRFAEFYIPEPMSGCSLWIGPENGNGYGVLSVRNVGYFAHRIAWALTRGPIPKGELVLHKCDNKVCVNPAHLYLGNYSENAFDAIRRGRRVYPRSETCVHGHPWGASNRQIRNPNSPKERQRIVCRECARDSRAKWFASHYKPKRRAL